jgi:hypothetical protein
MGSALARFPYEKARMIFMRVMAVVWMAEGLFAWAIILGIGNYFNVFQSASLQARLAISGFALFNLVASVGMWMLASWGAVIWLITIIMAIILDGTIADANLDPIEWPWVYALLGTVYLILLLGARRFKDPQSS